MGFFRSIFSFFRSLFQPRVVVEEVPGPQDGSELPVEAVEKEVSPETAGVDPIAIGSDIPVITNESDPVGPPATDAATGRTPQYLWCLDNGHGKSTPGKRSPVFSNGQQFFEYEFDRDIVARIMQGLDALGISYHEICPEVDLDVPLKTRVTRANDLDSALPKVFLSVHANAFGNGSNWATVKGIETWYYKGSSKGVKLASAMQRELIKANGWTDRGIRYHGNTNQAFYVLRKTKMPALLTENGYYTNRDECLQMLNPAVRETIAQAHIDAIRTIEDQSIENIETYSKIVQIG